MTPTTALISFGIITLAALMVEITYTYLARGFGYGFSSNRAVIERNGFGLRIQRAYQNQVEATAYIVPILAAAALTGLSGSGVELAALLIVSGRALFVALYYTGIPFIRIVGFAGGSMGSLYLAYRLLVG